MSSLKVTDDKISMSKKEFKDLLKYVEMLEDRVDTLQKALKQVSGQ